MPSQQLPDVTSDSKPEISLPLQWVGMEKIAVPIKAGFLSQEPLNIIAKVDVFTSLDSVSAKGIHMSRLHGVINQLSNIECNQQIVERLLDEIVSSQSGISSQAKITLAFDVPLKKPALLSGETGYQAYPVKIHAEKRKSGFHVDLEMTIPYSSTCPCSASLARQLQAEAIEKIFPDKTVDKKSLMEWLQSPAGSIATPHSQRSYAYLKLSIGNEQWPRLDDLIVALEQVIGTPVQTAVKRADEQEFARLNATNLMFCEDAARRIKHYLESIKFVKAYWFKIEHQESLHAHNAVVIEEKPMVSVSTSASQA